ncbi:trypsin-like peptidase domain-containing protein [Treponema sp. OMZ 840]|uniref:S1 family peptidase n=1 Tax=Treponema sp. OMZ 840 TaxID=244313 RepID=UPI003D8F1940
MKIKKNLLIVFLTVLLCVPLLTAQAVLRPEILTKLNDAVFEVVVLKPDEGSLEYEKKLPLERIPFAIRTDKYLPIGTAFLMDDGLFYSAAHVFNLHEESLYGDYFLRAVDGNIYKVDSLVSFATDRDYIVFTVENYTDTKKGLSAKENFSLNTQTFSVGNALGEGIIIRDGLLTSQTFEEENGSWKWLRFSAAASPGNSGGPLVTPDGDVLGIITMKSANENLNYALPFFETKKLPEGTGRVHINHYYVIPNILEEKFFFPYDYEQKLPKKLTQVRREVIADYSASTVKKVDEIRRKFDFAGDEGFNKGDGSYDILYTNWIPRFPLTVIRTDNKKWTTVIPNDIGEYKLPQNGSVSYGRLLNLTMAVIKRPENIAYEELIASPKLYMDYLLSASRMYRTVGSERIAITSYGQPARTHTHTDRYGRTWLVNYWSLPFANAEAVSFALPMPGGLYVMTKTDDTASIRNGHNLDLAFLSDYVIPRYSGTFKDWKEFLSIKAEVCPLDPVFASMKFDFTDKGTSVQNENYNVFVPRKIFASDKDTTLRFFLGFIEKNAELQFEGSGFDMYTKARNDDYRYVVITKEKAPGEDAPDEMRDKYRQKLERAAPFNGQAYNQNQYTYYDETLFLDGLNTQQKEKLPYIYILGLELKQQNKFKEIESFAKAMKKAIKKPNGYK